MDLLGRPFVGAMAAAAKNSYILRASAISKSYTSGSTIEFIIMLWVYLFMDVRINLYGDGKHLLFEFLGINLDALAFGYVRVNNVILEQINPISVGFGRASS
ncbi:unnamed protein product [Cuscuta epithymum]|uniref:Uncharacterized protein n=1 Tax=Cuscuta epithymum TaxID=186058 RepID=A0AAV0F400_9ASTE|nr:unnamed protein product [Cuscuta epithymum]